MLIYCFFRSRFLETKFLEPEFLDQKFPRVAKIQSFYLDLINLIRLPDSYLIWVEKWGLEKSFSR